MPIRDYEGQTFVAFLDISGLKVLMRDKDKAWRALDRLYQYGYEALSNQSTQHVVEGMFVSDSGVLFVRNELSSHNDLSDLASLLEVIEKINRRMRQDDFMLVTSVAYGYFKYQQRREYSGIGKMPIYGNAYVSAYLDNENGRPRIKPGQCRIVKANLPDEVGQSIASRCMDGLLPMIRERSGDRGHYYFYWMVDDPDEIDGFERQYRDAYSLKYSGMLTALKGEEGDPGPEGPPGPKGKGLLG